MTKQIKKHYTVMSDKECSKNVCDKYLKANVVERKPTAHLCFEHFREEEKASGNTISTAREVRLGKRPKRTHFTPTQFVKFVR